MAVLTANLRFVISLENALKFGCRHPELIRIDAENRSRLSRVCSAKCRPGFVVRVQTEKSTTKNSLAKKILQRQKITPEKRAVVGISEQEQKLNNSSGDTNETLRYLSVNVIFGRSSIPSLPHLPSLYRQHEHNGHHQ